MSLLGSYIDRLVQDKADLENARRREEFVYRYMSSTANKAYQIDWQPGKYAYAAARSYPNIVMDSWAAAFKARRYWESQTELRKAAGKVIY